MAIFLEAASYDEAIAALERSDGMWKISRDREEDGTFSYSCEVRFDDRIGHASQRESPLDAINKAVARASEY